MADDQTAATPPAVPAGAPPTPEPPATPPAAPEPPKAKGEPDVSQAYERVKGELETTKTQLKDAQDRLAAAKTLEDVEAAKAAIQKDYEAKLLERSIDAELIKAGCVNTKATQALIDITGIKLNGDVVEGLKVEDLAKQYPYLFSKVPTISTAAPSAGPADPAATERATYRAAAGLPPEKKE